MTIATACANILRWTGLLALAVAATSAPRAALAGPLQADDKAIHRSLVRIVANGSTSSGFLFGDDNRTVITTLHSVLPPGNNIEVFCRGNPTSAVVERYLMEADLVLLKAAEDLSALGCNPIAGLRVEAIPPPPGSVGMDLYAFGFKPGNSRSAFSKKLEKASGDPENLGALLPDKVVSKLRGTFMPDLRQPLYYVNGGIYPGYSGGPVFNDQGALVGVVQGGLDKGTSNHDWLVPSSTIAGLLAAPGSRELPDINPATFGYSAPPAAESSDAFIGSGPVVAMPGVVAPQDDPPIPEDDCYSEYYQHTWVKTRTRHFDALYDSSDPNDGLDQLLATILPPIATAAQANLQFDIYEEYCRGMVIAVPVGTQLAYEEFEDGEWLVAINALEMTDDQVMFRVSHEQFTFTLGDGSEIGPGDDDFIFEALDYYLDDCESLFDSCELDSNVFRLVAYSDGSAILRAGIVGTDADGFEAYNYHSLVISRGEMLEVETRAALGEDSAVAMCFAVETEAACGYAYWQPTAFMLANLLTNITGRPVDEAPVVLTGDDLLQDAAAATASDAGTGVD